MRAFLALIILAAALWRAIIDWQATIGQGYAFRTASLGDVVGSRWPQDYDRLVEGLHRSGVPYAWDPAGAFVMSVPVALFLAAVAGMVWATRPRRAR